MQCSDWTENKWGKTRNQSSIVLILLSHQRSSHRALYWPATFLRPSSDSVRVLFRLALSSLVFFPFLCSHLKRCKSTPTPAPQTHQIELSMPSGPQSSEHKWQLDYQPNWHAVSPVFQSREQAGELRCSTDDSNSKNPHLNRAERGRNLPFSSQVNILHTQVHAHVCINNDTKTGYKTHFQVPYLVRPDLHAWSPEIEWKKNYVWEILYLPPCVWKWDACSN